MTIRVMIMTRDLSRWSWELKRLFSEAKHATWNCRGNPRVAVLGLKSFPTWNEWSFWENGLRTHLLITQATKWLFEYIIENGSIFPTSPRCRLSHSVWKSPKKVSFEFSCQKCLNYVNDFWRKNSYYFTF